MKVNSINKQRTFMMAMILVSILSFVFNAAWAVDDSSPPVMTQGRLDAAEQRQVMISQKTPKDIVANKERFYVLPATVIINENGARVAYEDLSVPCKADVYFESKKTKNPKAVKIVVKEVLLGSSTAWTPGAPE